MRSALSRLGVQTQSETGYQAKFGLSLNPPNIRAITPNMISADEQINPNELKEASATYINDLNSDPVSGSILDHVINQALFKLGVTNGEFYMWQPEQPTMPDYSESPPYVLVVAKQNTTLLNNTGERILAACLPAVMHEADVDQPTELFAEFKAVRYMQQFEPGRAFGQKDGDKIQITVAQKPKHGQITIEDGIPDKYTPDLKYHGDDSLVLLVKQGDIQIEIRYVIYVDDFTNLKAWNCPYPEGELKVSSSFFSLKENISEGISTTIARDIFAFEGFTNLPSTSLGQTTGTGPSAKITLDTDAAGYGWFIDSTPLSNEEFLPTADANIWKAKAGSAAEGKMDMLSVLLHEYGHSLGLEHSTAASDAMAATLKPGERRLFTSDELAQLDRLRITFGAQVASLNSDPLTPNVPTGTLRT